MKDLIIIDCDQNSPEWHEARRGRFTASEISDLIFEPGVYKTGEKKGQDKPIPKDAIKLIDCKRSETKHGLTQHEIDIRVGRCVYPNFKGGIGINGEYGHIMESDAREYYSKKYSEEIYTVGFVVSKLYPDHAGCSPDALHMLKMSGVETKCPVTLRIHDTHLSLKCAEDLKNYSPEYYWQVLHNIFVCEAESWDFVSYFPWVKPEYVMSCLVVKRSEVEQDIELLQKCLKIAIELKCKL